MRKILLAPRPMLAGGLLAVTVAIATLVGGILGLEVDEQRVYEQPSAGELSAGAGRAEDGSGQIADGAEKLAEGLVAAALGSGKLAAGLGTAAEGTPKLVDGAQRLSDEGTKKLVEAGESTSQEYGELYAVIQAGSERAQTDEMAFGAPEGAAGLTAYTYEIRGDDGDSGRNWARGLGAVGMLSAGGVAFGLRRRLV